MDKEKFDLWVVSTKIWKEGAAVTHFMRDEIGGLRDANGDPLPDAVKEFFIDLLFLRVKPRKPRKGGGFLPKDSIRDLYKYWLFLEQQGLGFEQQADRGERLRGDETPSERVKECLSKQFRTSVATIDQIVSPRKSRQPRKPRKS